MMTDVTSLPDQLVMYLQLAGKVSIRLAPHLLAVITIILRISASKLLEETAKFLEDNWAVFREYDGDFHGPEYYRDELAKGRMHDLVIEAVCRMKGIQLLVRHLGMPLSTATVFGHQGPLFEAVHVNGQLFALVEAVSTWSEKRRREMAEEEAFSSSQPGPSRVHTGRIGGPIKAGKISKRRPQPEVRSFVRLPHVRPVLGSVQQSARRMSMLARRMLRIRTQLRETEQLRQELDAAIAVESRVEVGRDDEAGAVEAPAILPVAEAAQQLQESPAQAAQNEAGNVANEAGVSHASLVPPEAEAVQPMEQPFQIENGMFKCALPGCPTPLKLFRTLKGWKLHASHTVVHINQGFCTGCSHFVLAPPDASDRQKKIWLDSHKRERCAGASRKMMKERRIEAERLEGLWRNTSHLNLPGTEPDQENAQPRMSRKRVYPTEDERRMGLCMAYIKHFRDTNPIRLNEVAADFELSFT